MATVTPMISQYLQVKADYQDAFLFFRLGDFYEMFFDDAIKASQELEITLTSRDGGLDERIPMCGVPYHSASQYIEKLVEKGYKVAICEQVEDPKQAKGVVKREVVQLITPGTMMEGKGINERENNFIGTITIFSDQLFGFGYTDLSTGESKVTLIEGDFSIVLNEIAVIQTREIVIDSQMDEQYKQQIVKRFDHLTLSFESEVRVEGSFVASLQGLEENLSTTMARLFQYLHRTQKRSLDHLQKVQTYEIEKFMKIDYFSKRNLELTETIRSKGRKGSLLWLLDETKTAMGGRLLKQWLDRPLIQKNEILRRQALVETLIEHYFERQELREKLTEVYDIERLAGRVAFGNVNGRDLVQLKRSLTQIPYIKDILERLSSAVAKDLIDKLDPCEEVVDLIERSIKETPPVTIKEGDLIKDGYHPLLDKYREASRNGKQWIVELERQEREKTGIKSLKVGYNRVFGYYIEVTKPNLHLLKDSQYERKQTLTNAERFITPELKEKEALILEAEEKSIDLEYELFLEIREIVKEYIPRLQKLAKIISEIDCLQSFATVSEERHYVKPVFSSDRKLLIHEGRHPVVEKVMQTQKYVPNDCYMDENRELLLITGPNMSGKSTYMRQIALTAILAQIGCFVPAKEATLPIFDQVFTRIGAADDLISGQSTFMVEMLEANYAISHATKNSLILFDEIGRGTSTYDGMALAQAMIEYIHDHIGAKTLFSTHYHELTILEEQLSYLKNVHVSAIEQNGQVVFLHKIKEGAADKSYGIHVAQLAKLPNPLINRAKEILHVLENNESNTQDAVYIKKSSDSSEVTQLSLFSEQTITEDKNSSTERKVIDEMKAADLLEMTPMDAMNFLYKLQKKLKK